MSLAPSNPRRTSVWRSTFFATEAVGAAWIDYLRRRRELHDLAELPTMDDRALRDIGITRSEIRAALRSGSDLRSRRR
jgi:uncharacterized protein YjiS (DUF1127 family)